MLVQPLGVTPPATDSETSEVITALATATTTMGHCRRRRRLHSFLQAMLPGRSDKTEIEIARAEIDQVRKDCLKVGRGGDAHPLRQRCGVLLHADTGNHLAAREIVRRVQGLIREAADQAAAIAVQPAAVACAAENHLHTAPAVV